MNSTRKFIIEPGWQIIFKDLGINVSEVLTRAQLPIDLFSRQTTTVNSTEYFRFWIGLEATVKDPAFPLKLGQAIPVESFNPPLFAALCSPNLLVAMKRLSQFKQFFKPELRKRLQDLEIDASFRDRVRSALLELLPTGQSSIENVSRKLGVSKRTLQRRLQEESTNFKIELNQTREKLARYYLTNSTSSGGEISFLLGFDDPNSFFRAFHTWTGKTPENFRRESKSEFFL